MRAKKQQATRRQGRYRDSDPEGLVTGRVLGLLVDLFQLARPLQLRLGRRAKTIQRYRSGETIEKASREQAFVEVFEVLLPDAVGEFFVPECPSAWPAARRQLGQALFLHGSDWARAICQVRSLPRPLSDRQITLIAAGGLEWIAHDLAAQVLRALRVSVLAPAEIRSVFGWCLKRCIRQAKDVAALDIKVDRTTLGEWCSGARQPDSGCFEDLVDYLSKGGPEVKRERMRLLLRLALAADRLFDHLVDLCGDVRARRVRERFLAGLGGRQAVARRHPSNAPSFLGSLPAAPLVRLVRLAAPLRGAPDHLAIVRMITDYLDLTQAVATLPARCIAAHLREYLRMPHPTVDTAPNARLAAAATAGPATDLVTLSPSAREFVERSLAFAVEQLAADTRDTDRLLQRARALSRLGKVEAALAACDQAQLRGAPGAAAERGVVFSENDRHHEAIATLRSAVRRRPGLPAQQRRRAVLSLARSYLAAGRADEAVKLARQFTEENRSDGEAWEVLAQALRAAGRKRDTLQAAKNADRLGRPAS